MIGDSLDAAIRGTRVEWVALALLLVPTGFAAARAWGPIGVATAQRALLILVADLAVGLLLAFPVHVVPFVLAALPVAAASVSRAPASLRGHALAWPAAILVALPAVSVAHLGPYAWAPILLIGLPIAAILHGVSAAFGAAGWDAFRAFRGRRARTPPSTPDAPERTFK